MKALALLTALLASSSSALDAESKYISLYMQLSRESVLTTSDTGVKPTRAFMRCMARSQLYRDRGEHERALRRVTLCRGL